MRYGNESLKKINRLVMQLQYTIFMILPFSIFVVLSFILIPFAYVFGCIDKIRYLLSPYGVFKNKAIQAVLFCFFGLIILVLDTLTDVFYFWKNNFRQDLQKIIIFEELSQVDHRSYKQLQIAINRMQSNKIQSGYASTFIMNF